MIFWYTHDNPVDRLIPANTAETSTASAAKWTILPNTIIIYLFLYGNRRYKNNKNFKSFQFLINKKLTINTAYDLFENKSQSKTSKRGRINDCKWV